MDHLGTGWAHDPDRIGDRDAARGPVDPPILGEVAAWAIRITSVPFLLVAVALWAMTCGVVALGMAFAPGRAAHPPAGGAFGGSRRRRTAPEGGGPAIPGRR